MALSRSTKDLSNMKVFLLIEIFQNLDIVNSYPFSSTSTFHFVSSCHFKFKECKEGHQIYLSYWMKEYKSRKSNLRSLVRIDSNNIFAWWTWISHICSYFSPFPFDTFPMLNFAVAAFFFI